MIKLPTLGAICIGYSQLKPTASAHCDQIKGVLYVHPPPTQTHQHKTLKDFAMKSPDRKSLHYTSVSGQARLAFVFEKSFGPALHFSRGNLELLYSPLPKHNKQSLFVNSNGDFIICTPDQKSKRGPCLPSVLSFLDSAYSG